MLISGQIIVTPLVTAVTLLSGSNRKFEKEVADRLKGNDEAGMMDEDFLTALEYGLSTPAPLAAATASASSVIAMKSTPKYRNRPVCDAADGKRLYSGCDFVPHDEAGGLRKP